MQSSCLELLSTKIILLLVLEWVVEYQIDGFQFHSLSSMMYTHNGFASSTGDLEEYCNQYVDKDALLYLILTNEILHVLHPNMVTIAEDALAQDQLRALLHMTRGIDASLNFGIYDGDTSQKERTWLRDNS